MQLLSGSSGGGNIGYSGRVWVMVLFGGVCGVVVVVCFN